MSKFPVIVDRRHVTSTAFRDVRPFFLEEVLNQEQVDNANVVEDLPFKFQKACLSEADFKKQNEVPELEFLKLMQVQEMRGRIYVAPVANLLREAVLSGFIKVGMQQEPALQAIKLVSERFSVNLEQNRVMFLQLMGTLPRFQSQKQFLSDIIPLTKSTMFFTYTNDATVYKK